MIYLKNFNNENDYLTYRDGSGYGKPNVSLSIDSKAVHYNYLPIDTNGFDFVNLELPSGTLWATCNVGASKLTDYGLYFQWGDTLGYSVNQFGKEKQFTWENYKWSIDGSDTNFSKYTTQGEKLELEDDAHVYMEGDWHMPTSSQIQELAKYIKWEWTTLNGVNGRLLTSKINTEKSIFIPAAGYVLGDKVYDSGTGGYVWTSMLSSTTDVKNGNNLGFSSSRVGFGDYSQRKGGFSIRGVIG